MNRDLLIDLTDDALDRLDRLQRWWNGQSPHPVLTQTLLAIVMVGIGAASYAQTNAFDLALYGAMFCIAAGWVCGLLGCVRSVGSIRPQPTAVADDDATVDLDPEAMLARRRLKLWSACFWWLQAPWVMVALIRLILVGIALVGDAQTDRVGLGCTQVPLWAVSLPVCLWLWQRHFRRQSRASGSRTEDDLDARVWWFAALSAGMSFVLAGLLII